MTEQSSSHGTDGGGYDVIGDVHGHADALIRLLAELGYQDVDGVWRHPERTAVFLGDLIDRGPQQLLTVRIVRRMVEDGHAQIVMGNHEFNAIAYATWDEKRGDYCRPHSPKNRRQHTAFIEAVEFGSTGHQSIIDWFRTMPLWLDLGGLRIVHACWSPSHLTQLRKELGGDTLTDASVVLGTDKVSETYKSIEILLKGPEIRMDDAYYYDKDGVTPRYEARLRWWDPKVKSLRKGAMISAKTQLYKDEDRKIRRLSKRKLGDDELIRYEDKVPVLYGHYWWTPDDQEREWQEYATCLDYSIAKEGGSLAAYRWGGEKQLDARRIVTVDRTELGDSPPVQRTS